MILSLGVDGGSLKPIMSAVCWTVFSCFWCLSNSSRDTRCARTYCKYVSATHAISSGPRQYCAGVTRLERYSDKIHRNSGRFSILPSAAKYRSSRLSDRRIAKDVFPDIFTIFVNVFFLRAFPVKRETGNHEIFGLFFFFC